MAEKHYEMLWDCQFCGTPKLLGKTHRHCPNCGAQQIPESRYYPDDEEKVAVEDHVFVGADVSCPACATLNGASATFCGNCGSSLDAGNAAVTMGAETRAAGEAFMQSGVSDVAQQRHEQVVAAAQGLNPADEATGGGRGRVVMAVLGVVGVVAVVLGVLFTRTTNETVVVTGHAWERTINVEAYQTVSEGAWRDQVPSDARGLSCQQRQRDTIQVPDGQDCRTVRQDLGDGTFSERQECTTRYRSEPVLDSYCDYRVDRWRFERAVETQGAGLSPAPAWGNPDLSVCGGVRLGCEREQSRDESYTVEFRGEDQTYTCDFPLADWSDVPIESTWTIEVRQFMPSSALCGSLARTG